LKDPERGKKSQKFPRNTFAKLTRRQEFFEKKDYLLIKDAKSFPNIDVPISWKKDYVSLSNIKTKYFCSIQLMLKK